MLRDVTMAEQRATAGYLRKSLMPSSNLIPVFISCSSFLSLFWSCGSRSRPQIPDSTFNTFLIPQYRVHKHPAAQFLILNFKFLIQFSF